MTHLPYKGLFMNASVFQRLLGAAALVLGMQVSAADITGAGATFPYPIYAKWA